MELNVVSKRRKNHEYKNCPDNAGSDENASCDGNAFLGMRYAQQTKISQRSAANHESVRASWLEPFKFSFLSDAVSYDDGYDRSHHPVKYEPAALKSCTSDRSIICILLVLLLRVYHTSTSIIMQRTRFGKGIPSLAPLFIETPPLFSIRSILSEIYHVCHVPVKRHTKYLRIIHTMHSHLAADELLTGTTSSRKSSVLCSI